MKRSGTSRPRPRVVWDEQNLDFLEAHKTPKQKINEPKTPYHAPDPDDALASPSPVDDHDPMDDGDNANMDDRNHANMDDQNHANNLRDALWKVASKNGAGTSQPRNSGWTSSEEEAEDMDHDIEGSETNGRRSSFEERRRAHYDEYWKAKQLTGHEMSDEEAEMGGGREDGERHLPGGGSCSRQSQQDHESSLSRSLGGIDLQAAEM